MVNRCFCIATKYELRSYIYTLLSHFCNKKFFLLETIDRVFLLLNAENKIYSENLTVNSELATTFVFFSEEINNLKTIDVSRFGSGPLVARRDSTHFRCASEQAICRQGEQG